MSVLEQMKSHPLFTDKFTEHLKDVEMYLINLLF